MTTRAPAAPLVTNAHGRKLHIDWTACDGRGLCIELAPELLTPDDWGFPIARLVCGTAVPNELLDVARDAVAACPKRALRLIQG